MSTTRRSSIFTVPSSSNVWEISSKKKGLPPVRSCSSDPRSCGTASILSTDSTMAKDEDNSRGVR